MKKLVFPLVGFFALVAVLLFSVFFSIASSRTTHANSNGLQSVRVTFYTDEGTMADGQQTHVGACAALVTQYAFGTKIQLFDPRDLQKSQFSCTIEDTGRNICQSDIDVALPGQVDRAIQLGVEQLQLKVVGFDQRVADEAAANHPVSAGC